MLRNSLACIIIVFLCAAYTNCGDEKFAPKNEGSSSSTARIEGQVSFSQLESCVANGGISGLTSCLTKHGAILNSEIVGQCASLSQENRRIAGCLTKNGFPVTAFREVFQSDIDACKGLAGEGGLIPCLAKRGARTDGLTPAILDECARDTRFKTVESCLRSRGLLASRAGLLQEDIDVCIAVEQPATLSHCLRAKGVLSYAILQPQLKPCLDAGVGTAANCLRSSGVIPKRLMQNFIDRCVKEAGVSGVEACLTSNGLLTDVLKPITRADLSACQNSSGFGALSKCLVTNGFLSSALTQDHLTTCATVAGISGIAACLSANGVLPPAIAQANIDACAANGVAVEGLLACLVPAAQ